MRSPSAIGPRSPIMHLVMKTRNNASLHERAFHRAHLVSHGVFRDGARRPDGALRALANALRRRPHLRALRVGRAGVRGQAESGRRAWVPREPQPRSEAASTGVQIGGGAPYDSRLEESCACSLNGLGRRSQGSEESQGYHWPTWVQPEKPQRLPGSPSFRKGEKRELRCARELWPLHAGQGVGGAAKQTARGLGLAFLAQKEAGAGPQRGDFGVASLASAPAGRARQLQAAWSECAGPNDVLAQRAATHQYARYFARARLPPLLRGGV
jgi:hypothetical protein